VEIGPSFPCINCGADVQVFYYKTGERAGWSCPECKSRGFFKHQGARDQAILIEA
jgi:DNA-directed RNA polymerase subunit RPC12/RpoP